MKHQSIEIAPGIEPVRLSPGMLPVAPLLARLARIDRPRLEAFIETGIELLDLFDGDSDIEEDDPREDDDPSGQKWSEEYLPSDEGMHLRGSPGGLPDCGPGCPIADPGGCEHDGREPVSEY